MDGGSGVRSFIDPVIIVGLIMERVAVNPPASPDRVIVLQAARLSRPTAAAMTSWRWKSRGVQRRPSRRFWEGSRASPRGAVSSSDPLNSRPRTDVAELRFQRFYIVWAFQKQTLTGKGP